MSKVIVLGLSGPSCSGKTTIALNLLKLFPHTVIIHQDDFYKSDNQIPVDSQTGFKDWDCPAAFEMEKLAESICSVRKQLETQEIAAEAGNIRDHFASQWANPPSNVDNLLTSLTLESIRKSVLNSLGVGKTEDIPFSIILVDGILLFHDPSVTENGDMKAHPGKMCDTGLFVYARYLTLKARREARSGYATKDGLWVDPPGYFGKLVWPNFLKYNAGVIAAHLDIGLGNPDGIGACSTAATTSGDSWGGKIAVCSSDMPAEETLRICVKYIVDEWRKRC
ncbi:hypothetical protein BX661DRAFT_167905 [Kickxella alabastrina]|uniref:uncharacterized protein n=1 Tax=Kickxella alabastrina TaxID=61397 RepID=UPI002220BF3A|nr:uncharacterized protein BX661DRAFT_167905 [Kickxella alabastrina]KAI7834683.1 hypothetical protein BX661DRAFT_167905 [Kickxella alabastrina]